MNRRQAIAMLAFAPAAAAGAPPSIDTIGHGQWASIRAGLAGAPAIVHLWGVTCAPCLAELPAWRDFLQRHRRARVIFVHFDPVPQARVLATLQRAGLLAATHYAIRGFPDERLRYEFDPDWGGELPRTLLIGHQGSVQAGSGSTDFAQLRQWWLEESGRMGGR